MATNPQHQTVEFTPAKLEKFRVAYAKAKLNPITDEFEFEGMTYVLGYAKYLIQYLEKQFGVETRGD